LLPLHRFIPGGFPLSAALVRLFPRCRQTLFSRGPAKTLSF
jgi:hypothetical protein